MAVALLIIATEAPASAADDGACGPVVQKLRAAIAARPARLLLAVEDALAAGESCAGSIVAAAIEATGADDRLVGDIVFTAVSASPSMTAAIAEAAIGAAPGSSATVKTAMRRALGDEAPARPIVETPAAVPSRKPQPTSPAASDPGPATGTGGKEPASVGKDPVPVGKTPIPEAPAPAEEPFLSDDFALFSGVGIGGIYLVTPGFGVGVPQIPTIEITPRPPQKRRKVTVPGRPVSPVDFLK